MATSVPSDLAGSRRNGTHNEADSAAVDEAASGLGLEWALTSTPRVVLRRYHLVMVSAAAIIAALLIAVDLPPLTQAVWREQWWGVGVFIGMVASQTGYRMRSGNARRRTTSTVTEGSVVIALFWLNPWLVVVGRLLGAVLGWMAVGLLSRRQRAFYLAFHTIEILVVVWFSSRIHAEDSFYSWRPLVVAGMVWVVSVVSRVVTVATATWVRTGRFHQRGRTMHAWASFVSAASVVFGLMGSMMIDLIWLGVIPTVISGMLLTRTGNSVRHVQTTERSLDELVWLSARTGGARPTQIESDLVEAIDRISKNATCSVATITEDGNIEWLGRVSRSLKRAVIDAPRLRSMARFSADHFAPRAYGLGCIGVWTLDSRTGSMLVIESSRRPDQVRGLQNAVDTLVSSARLGITTSRQLDDLQAQAASERIRARTDATTGLPNWLAATGFVDERVAAGLTESIAAVVVSIDGLNEIVDVLGGDTGAAIANAYATRLRRRAPGFVARIADNSFVAIVDGGAEAALACADRLTEVARTAVGDEVFTYQVSAGVAICQPEQDLAAEQLFRRADLALHESRLRGSTVVFGDAEADYEARRAEIRIRLAEAIANKSIRPAFQPQIDLDTGRLAGLEVLARWNDSELGFVSPGEFIPIAEQSRQIELLTVSMLTQALEAAVAWQELGVAVPISVNLSAQSLMWPKFLQYLIDIVVNHDIEPELLTAEITESTLVAGPAVIDAIGRLRELGARISIDDFGTGYSALSYMNTLPIHELKIDRSMVESIGDVDDPSPIVKRLIDLCADLDYSVVAEGIETEEQAALLALLGCQIGQGYFFARPMMQEEMTEWIRAGHQFEIELPVATTSSVDFTAEPSAGPKRADGGIEHTSRTV